MHTTLKSFSVAKIQNAVSAVSALTSLQLYIFDSARATIKKPKLA